MENTFAKITNVVAVVILRHFIQERLKNISSTIWRTSRGEIPLKKISKKFKKTLDKLPKVCYNKYIN
jgi:hypothetical protein